MIIRAPAVVTMNGAPLSPGALRVRNGRIVEVQTELTSDNDELIELDDCVLLPGLINAHCHLDYTCLRGRIPCQASFTDWIRAINTEKAKLTADDYLASIAEGFREAQRFGTTSIVNLEAFPELIARAEATPLRTWWCPELIDVSAPERLEEIVATAVQSIALKRNERGGFGLAPHALFTASAELFRRCQEVAAREGLLLTTHLAESREEMQMFSEAAGPLFEFIASFVPAQHDGGTPVVRFLEMIRDPSAPLHRAREDKMKGRCTRDDKTTGRSARDHRTSPAWDGKLPRGFALHESKWIVAHLNELTAGDLELLGSLPEKFTVAHCPRSHAYFRHSRFEFEKLRALGFNVCLATDSLASNDDLSLFAEMRAFRKTHPQLSAEDILEMVTVNPAFALGRAHDLGRIGPGFLADMIALPLARSGDVYEQIINFDCEVQWMMINGEIL